MNRFARRVVRRLAVVAFASAFFGASLGPTGGAHAQSAYCDDLKARIAQTSGRDAGRYRVAAAKQRSEYNRTAAYAQSLGCDRSSFLIFGEDPPRQCGAINARLGQMRANLAALEQRGGEDVSGVVLRQRYDAECRDRPVQARARPKNLFEELFGVAPPEGDAHIRTIPVDPEGEPREAEDERARGGPMAICVRSCDGGFFPVSYTARRSSLDTLASLCKALCPNVETTLYTRSQWGDLKDAVSVDGASYADHPRALQFQKSYDASCTCKPPGKSWVEALEDAERLLAERNSKDEMLSAEKAEQLSRPKAAVAPGERAGGKPAAEAPLRGATPETADADKGAAPVEVFRDVVGPDGVKRRVRVVAPTL